jgi:hypothetical protein
MRWVWIRGRRSGKQAELVPGDASVRVATPCLLETIGAGWSSMGLGGCGMAASARPHPARGGLRGGPGRQVLPDPDVVVVVPVMAVHGAQIPWGKVVMNGVPVVAARRLPSMLRALPAVLAPGRVAALADQARIRFHAAT